jgi:hypothetical protein
MDLGPVMAPTGTSGFAEREGDWLQVLIRAQPEPGALRRFVYRAEPARDWEPRLDGLWERVRASYPTAAVRDADHALRHFAGHQTVRYHRFLVLPRFSSLAVAWAVFADHGGDCCWIDLLWDRDRPGALELLAHISGRLAAQWGSGNECLVLAGDDAATALLADRGFRQQAGPPPTVGLRSLVNELDAAELAGRGYLTAADVGGLDP